MTVYRVGTVNLRYRMADRLAGQDVTSILKGKAPDVLGLQECGKASRKAAVTKAAQTAGYSVSQPAGSPLPILYRSDRFALVKAWTVFLSPRTFVGLPGAGLSPWYPECRANVAVLKDKTSGVLSVYVNVHLVASIYLPVRGRLHKRQLENLDRLVGRLQLDYPDAGLFVFGDFNCDAARVRKAIGLMGGTTAPTLKKRAIDHVFSNVAAASVEVMPHLHTDHHAVISEHHREEKPVPTPEGFMPGAIVKNIPPGVNDPGIKPVGGVCHVAVSEADSLYDYFNGPSGGVESHFYVRYDGTIEQYRSIYFEADANLKGNSFLRDGVRCGLLSIETAGLAAGTWTPEQLASIRAIITWANKEAGVPIDLITRWDGDGWGYHVMFGAPGPWTPVAKTCPGPRRVEQFTSDLAPWLKAGGDKPKPERVHAARVKVREAVALLRATPEPRKGAHALADALDAVLADPQYPKK